MWERCYNIVKREAKMQYTIFVRKAPDGFYIASSPLIPEARAQGETYDECVANIKEVLELCLEIRRERAVNLCPALREGDI